MYGNLIENYIAGTGMSVKKMLYMVQGQYYRNDNENCAHYITFQSYPTINHEGITTTQEFR